MATQLKDKSAGKNDTFIEARSPAPRIAFASSIC